MPRNRRDPEERTSPLQVRLTPSERARAEAVLGDGEPLSELVREGLDAAIAARGGRSTRRRRVRYQIEIVGEAIEVDSLASLIESVLDHAVDARGVESATIQPVEVREVK